MGAIRKILPKSALAMVLAVTAAAPLAAEVAKPGGSWSERAPLLDERTEVSVTTDGQHIFLAGGFGPDDSESATAPRAVHVYDPEADEWSQLTELPEGVNHAGLEYLDGKLYLIAGYQENTFDPIDDLRIFDLETETWSDGAALPTPRGALATAVLDGRIHAIGGTTRGEEDVGAHEVYDPQSNSWTERAPMPTARNHHAAAVIGNRIVVLAGRDDTTFRLTTNEVYDANADAWHTGAEVPTGRSGVATAVLNGKVYLFGGETFEPERSTFDEAERYDPEADAWETLPPMPTARHGLGAAAIEDGIYVISGGPEAGLAFSDKNEMLVPEEVR